MVRAALGTWDHMVYGEVAKRERLAAPRAASLLSPEYLVFVGPVVGQFTQVRPLGDVGTANRIEVVE